jgi:hypothetical protein
VRAAVVGRGYFDVVVIPAAVWLLIFDPQVGEMDLVIEVREVVLERPGLNLFRVAIGMAVVVIAVAIPLVEPLLIVALELVVEYDAIDAGVALLEAFGFTKIGATDLGVVFQFTLAFEARVERLMAPVVAASSGEVSP